MIGGLKEIGKKMYLDKPLKALRFGKLALNHFFLSETKEISSLPEVINLNATEFCNSHCVMCNIWKKDANAKHLNLEEYKIILSDPLFRNVKHVGVTGGEPTLREDLSQIYGEICDALPMLIGTSMITNCIKSDEVIERIGEVNRICREKNKRFSVMMSLDGIGKDHDKNRGTKGNFQGFLKVKQYLETTDIPFRVGVTLTKSNVWKCEEIYSYVVKEGLAANFRIAEFINRLDNNSSKYIRNFDSFEIYHLTKFFMKLRDEYEESEEVKRTYSSIISVLNGGKRLISCPYKKGGVVLNGYGEIAYCAPKSNVFKPENETYLDSYTRNIEHKKEILKSKCESCIHDYHAPISFIERKNELKEAYFNRLIRIDSIRYSKFLNSKKIDSKSILITGWYGTETAGDKAILAQIILDFKKSHANYQIKVTSLHPLITQNTLRQLDFSDIEIIPVHSRAFIDNAISSEIVVMGGGPLMDMEALSIPLWAFVLAKKRNKKTMIYGCGLGPLYDERYINTVQRILEFTDVAYWRDKASFSKYLNNYKAKEIESKVIVDPAIEYVKTFKTDNREMNSVLACFLRDWPIEYAVDKSNYQERKKKFEKGIADLIHKECKKYNLKPVLFCMHTFHVGGDDRKFNRRFAEEYLTDLDYELFEKESSVIQVSEAMNFSKKSICMRYHSVAFANTLGVDFIAIDYTEGGKIKGYLKDENRLEKLKGIDDIIAGNF